MLKLELCIYVVVIYVERMLFPMLDRGICIITLKILKFKEGGGERARSKINIFMIKFDSITNKIYLKFSGNNQILLNTKNTF